MSTLLPAIPEPQSATLPALLDACEAVVMWAETCDDIGTVREVYDKFAAIAEYLTRRDAAQEASATMRRLEVRIGQLLGPPRRDHDRTPGAKSITVDIGKDERSDFRAMAAHPDLVDEAIAESTQREPASRRKVLARIAEKKLDAVRDALRSDADAQERADVEEMRDFAKSVTPDDYDPAEDRHSVAVRQAIIGVTDGIADLERYTVDDIRRALNHSNPKVRDIILPDYTAQLRHAIEVMDRYRELTP